MISLAIQQFLARWQRSLAVFIAVTLGVAFFAIAMLAGGPLNQSLRVGVGEQINGADLIVTSSSENLSDIDLEHISDLDNVNAADVAALTPAGIQAEGENSFILIANAPAVPAVRDQIELLSGVWPKAPGEIVIAEGSMDTSGLVLGDDVMLELWIKEEPMSFRIVGISSTPSSLAMDVADAFVSPSDFQLISPDAQPFAVRVQLEDGANQTQALGEIQSILGSEYDVQPYADYVDREVERLSGNTVALQVLIAAFAAVAMLAAGLVISNSFEINLAQRVREIGLLRSVGASNKQVRRMVLAEALTVGAIASIFGVALGIAVMELAGRLVWASNSGSTGLDLTPVTIFLPFILGLIATLISAYSPARGAMRVHPLQAIRQSEAPVVTVSASRKRTILGTLIFGAGALIMVVAGMSAMTGGAESGIPLLLGIMGGALTFFAVLMCSQIILPAIAGILGSLTRRLFGVTGELAVGNLSRNPRRTSSAAAALLVGVTLMTMMTVGASSVKSTIVGEVNDRQPIDLEIRIDTKEIEVMDISGEINRWSSVDGVSTLAPFRTEQVTLTGGGDFSVLAVDASEGQQALRSESLDDLAETTIVIDSDTASVLGVEDDSAIEATGTSSTLTLTVVIQEVGVGEPVISDATMNALMGDGEHSGVWIQLENDATVGTVMDEVRAGLPTSMDVSVSGGAAERESTLEILDTMLLVVIGLLAASVVIAVVGIGNTLTLSVIERTRESGVLRAMGLKRNQVRKMLAIEGAIISVVGAIGGLVLGSIYGFAGVFLLFGDAFDLTFTFPWGQLLMIAAVALTSGVLASFLPAKKALQVNPVEALSHVG